MAAFSLLLSGALTGTSGTASKSGLPAAITSIMHKPRYAHATWNLLVVDLKTNQTLYALNADNLAFTGSARKLFSVGVALNQLGAGHRFTTPVYRRGSVSAGGRLKGDLLLVGGGDLTLGGRSSTNDTLAFTNFDHNDANNLGTAILTPQDPLRGLNALARQVRASGIRSVEGDVVVDDRLFEPYRVPNGHLLITPILVNENDVDVTVTPTRAGRPARLDWRPKTAAFAVNGSVMTVAAGKPADISLSNDGLAHCRWPAPCVGRVSGTIPVRYKAPLSGSAMLVRIFRIEDPASFARIAFVQALQRAGVSVRAPLVAKNKPAKLPPRGGYASASRVATFVSPPYSEDARLILKVSLNVGANLSLSLFGVAKGTRTISGALAAERNTLVNQMGVPRSESDFPTNGSGSPDSRAAPRATVRMLTEMSKRATFSAYRAALPILGVDGSLAGAGKTLPAKGHVFAKPGTTIANGSLKAQVLAGYIDAKSSRHLAFALYVNDAGPLQRIADVETVFNDEAQILNAIYLAK